MKDNASALLIALLLTGAPPSRGYISPIENQTSVIVTNDWNLGHGLYVGETTSTNSMFVTDGAFVQSSNGFVGYGSNALYNAVTVDGPGTRWDNSNLLRIGAYGSFNTLSISNGSIAVNYSYGEIGFHESTSGNLVEVTGPGSTWYNGFTLRVGYYGRTNALFITDGGYVDCEDGRIGYQSNACNNVVGVDGSGSVWNQRTELGIGADGSENGLLITDGGIVNTEESGTLGGRTAATGNTALVLGYDSEWNVGSVLRVGWGGSSNRLTIADGGRVSSTTGMIGLNVDSSANEVLVDGTGSVWTASSWLKVGQDGAGNSLIITNGGKIISNFGGIGAVSSSDNNTVLLTGADSTWDIASGINIGNRGKENSMRIEDGGLVNNTFANIGKTFGADQNMVTVTGADSAWINSSELSVGNKGSRNELHIQDGGQVSCGGGYIGNNETGSSNSVIVAGTGSLLEPDSLRVGYEGSGNSLMITSGGAVSTINWASIGRFVQSSHNHATVTGTGSVWRTGTSLEVGNEGRRNELRILDGGYVANTYACIGRSTDSFGNSTLISGTGSLWECTSSLYIGGNPDDGTGGTANSLTITNGGSVTTTAGFIGFANTASSNWVNVAGTGATWNCSSLIRVGAKGSENKLHIKDGGRVDCSLASIGEDNAATGNIAIVEGENSVWNLDGGLTVGTRGSGNRLSITNGGTVSSINVFIGFNEVSHNNHAYISGMGSSWITRSIHQVGQYGSSNSFLITDGGCANSVWATIGRFSGSDNNHAVVSGTNSQWNLSQGIGIGSEGCGNTLILSDGGEILCNAASIGVNTLGSNNTATATGAGTRWICRNNMNVGGRKFAIGGTGNAITVSAGATISTPLLNIYPGNDFHLLNGGRLEAGSVNGDLAVHGTFAPGNSTASVTLNGSLALGIGGSIEMEIGGYDLGTEYDHLSITGLTALEGTLDVVFTDGFVPMFGTFNLFDYSGGVTGTFDSTHLPALPAGRTWNTNNLYTAGELMVLCDPMADSNENGIEDGWEMQYFGSPVSPTNNPDSDLFNNMEEYIAGTDPTNGASYFMTTNATAHVSGFIVEWAPSISNRLYGVNWSTNLTTGFHPLETGIEYPRTSCTDTVHAAENQCFYQVEVQLK